MWHLADTMKPNVIADFSRSYQVNLHNTTDTTAFSLCYSLL